MQTRQRERGLRGVAQEDLGAVHLFRTHPQFLTDVTQPYVASAASCRPPLSFSCRRHDNGTVLAPSGRKSLSLRKQRLRNVSS